MSHYSENSTSFHSGRCFICSAENVNTNLNSPGKKLCERFWILVGRYLNLNIKNNSNLNNCKFDFNKTLNNRKQTIEVEEAEKVCCCKSCLVEVEVFCIYFQQFSLIQLQLNATLNKIAQLMKSKNPRSEENISQRIKFDHEEKFRSAVVSGVESGTNNFPRLQLSKLNLKAMSRTDLNLTTDASHVNLDPEEVVTLDDKTAKIVSVSSDSNLSKLLESSENVPANVKLHSETRKSFQVLGKTIDLDILTPAFLKCRFCDNFYINKESRAEHERITHEIQRGRRFTCRYCDAKFSHLQNLQGHERIHTREKPFSCSICHKKFTHRSSCYPHLRTVHNNEKGRIIVDNSLVTKRQRLRIQELSSKIQGKPLKRHQQTVYVSRKRFSCQLCGEIFTAKSSLQRHQYIHKDCKPYKCGLCEYQTTYMGMCRQHQWKIHQIRNGVVIHTLTNSKIDNDKTKSTQKSLSVERQELTGDVNMEISDTFMVKREPTSKNQNLFSVEGTVKEEQTEGDFILPDLFKTKPTMAPSTPELNTSHDSTSWQSTAIGKDFVGDKQN